MNLQGVFEHGVLMMKHSVSLQGLSLPVLKDVCSLLSMPLTRHLGNTLILSVALWAFICFLHGTCAAVQFVVPVYPQKRVIAARGGLVG